MIDARGEGERTEFRSLAPSTVRLVVWSWLALIVTCVGAVAWLLVRRWSGALSAPSLISALLTTTAALGGLTAARRFLLVVQLAPAGAPNWVGQVLMSAAMVGLGSVLSAPQASLVGMIVWWSALAASETWWWTTLCTRVAGAVATTGEQPASHAAPDAAVAAVDRLEFAPADSDAPASHRDPRRETIVAESTESLTKVDVDLRRSSGPANAECEESELSGDSDESDEGDDGELLPAGVEQQVTRRRDAAGSESLEGIFRVRFAAGERMVHLHLSFCPPWTCVPHVEPQQLMGPAVQLQVAQSETFGARIELRRTAIGTEAEVLIFLAVR